MDAAGRHMAGLGRRAILVFALLPVLVVLGCPTLALADSYSSAVIANSPLSYWRLDESAGPTVHDQMGQNNGTASGGASFGQPGAVQGDAAMGFDGVSGVVDFGSPSSLNTALTGSYTVEYWLRSTSTAIGRVLGKWNGPQGHPGLFATALNIEPQYVGRLSFSTGDGADVNALLSKAANLNDGAWHYVVLERDASVSPAIQSMYIDGQFDSSRSESIPPSGNANSFQIGHDGSAFAEYFAGSVDEVAIYQHLLSTAQIGNHYSAATGKPPPPSDLPISVKGVPFAADSGQPFSDVVATLHDNDPSAISSDYSVVINWGDGTQSPGTVETLGGGDFEIFGARTYTAQLSNGQFDVVITVVDEKGRSDSGGASASDILINIPVSGKPENNHLIGGIKTGVYGTAGGSCALAGASLLGIITAPADLILGPTCAVTAVASGVLYVSDPPDLRYRMVVGTPSPINLKASGRCPTRFDRRSCGVLRRDVGRYLGAEAKTLAIDEALIVTADRLFSARAASDHYYESLQLAVERTLTGELFGAWNAEGKAGGVVVALLRRHHVALTLTRSQAAGARHTLRQLLRRHDLARLGLSTALMRRFERDGLSVGEVRRLVGIGLARGQLHGALNIGQILSARAPNALLREYELLTPADLVRLVRSLFDQGTLSSGALTALGSDLRTVLTAGTSSARHTAVSRFVSDVPASVREPLETLLGTAAGAIS